MRPEVSSRLLRQYVRKKNLVFYDWLTYYNSDLVNIRLWQRFNLSTSWYAPTSEIAPLPCEDFIVCRFRRTFKIHSIISNFWLKTLSNLSEIYQTREERSWMFSFSMEWSVFHEKLFLSIKLFQQWGCWWTLLRLAGARDHVISSPPILRDPGQASPGLSADWTDWSDPPTGRSTVGSGTRDYSLLPVAVCCSMIPT